MSRNLGPSPVDGGIIPAGGVIPSTKPKATSQLGSVRLRIGQEGDLELHVDDAEDSCQVIPRKCATAATGEGLMGRACPEQR